MVGRLGTVARALGRMLQAFPGYWSPRPGGSSSRCSASFPFLFVAWTVELAPAALRVPTAARAAMNTAFENPLNEFFESTSGFAGTGLTMTDDESVLPATLQWWRSFIE